MEKKLWKWQVPRKRPYACTKLHGILFQMTENLKQFCSHITTDIVSIKVRPDYMRLGVCSCSDSCLRTSGRFYTARVQTTRSTGALGSSDSTQSRHFVEQLAKAHSV
jgi:hypothetical protein